MPGGIHPEASPSPWPRVMLSPNARITMSPSRLRSRSETARDDVPPPPPPPHAAARSAVTRIEPSLRTDALPLSRPVLSSTRTFASDARSRRMDEFRGRVAVVTGGGSGLGAEMARSFAGEGAKIVLADLDSAAMDQVAGEIAKAGGEAIGIRTDVTKRVDVEALAKRAFERFGAAHIVCNNAGVGVFGTLATATDRDWQWVMNVNFWGVVHGIDAFVPRMIE